jgi:uncharacterized protein YfaS (alpha-2-macroglobulin family)
MTGTFPLPGNAAEDDLTVVEFSPQGQVDNPSDIRIAFSAPVITSDDVGKTVTSKDLPVTFSPRIAGQGRWISRSEFIYQLPSGYLPETTQFSAEVKDDLKDAGGRTIKGDKKFLFNTPALAFIGIKQTDFSASSGFVEYEIRFNAPVHPQKLTSFISFVDKNKLVLEYQPNSYQVSNSFLVRVLADDGSPITVNIEPGLSSERGPLLMKDPVSVKTDRDLSLKIKNSWIYNSYDSPRIYIDTTAQIDTEKAKSFVEVTPAGNFNLGTENSGLSIYGEFKPRELITVKLRKGLPSTEGAPLGEDWERSFVFPDFEPSLSFSSSGRFISPANEELLIPISSVNIDKLNVGVERVYDNNVTMVTRTEWPYYLADLSERIYNETFPISSEPNETALYSIDLKKILDGKKGLFEVSAHNSDNYWPSILRVINVTDIAGSAKIGDKSALVWANSIADGKPMKDVKVSVYSSSNQLIASGKTDEHGVCSIKRETEWSYGLWPNLITLDRDGDVSILRLEENIWRTGNEDYSGAPYLKGKYYGLCYAPRGVFRPGESVPIQMIIRTASLLPDAPFPVQLRIRSSLGREWNVQTVMLSEMGLGSAEIQLGETSPTGTWKAEVYIPGETDPIATGEFLVEDFAPPKIEVLVSSDQKVLFPEDETNLRISSEYLFGAPGDGLNYEVQSSLIPREYSNSNWPDYIFSDYRTAFNLESNIEATGTLSEAGDADVTLPGKNYSARSMLDVIFRVGVMEDSGRWVYKSLALPYYPKNNLLGIKHPSGEFLTQMNVPLAFAAVDTEGNPAPIKDAKLYVYRAQTRRIMTTSGNERRSELRTENIPLLDYDGKPISFKDGRADANVTFSSGGLYTVAVEDPSGEAHAAAMQFYVYDARWGYGAEGDETLPETLKLTLDKDKYKIGEQATVTVSGSFEGTVLMSVETDTVLHYDTSAKGEKTAEFSFKITKDMAPNAWITAHMIRAASAEDVWSAHRAFGAISLALDNSDIKLGVDISSPEIIRPAETNEFSVRLKDSSGHAVSGEVTVMLVDDAVLGLTGYKTPNFYDYYTAKRELTLGAYDIYTQLMPLYLKNPTALTPGGGDDDSMGSMLAASLSPVRANRFKILTICRNVLADKNGVANFSLDIPEFAGRARLMAVASSRESFGSAEKQLTITRDVVSDVTLPRVLAPGDIFESQIQLFNRTERSQDMTVELNISGPLSLTKSLEDSSDLTLNAKKYSRRISLPAGSKAFVIPLIIKADDDSGVANVELKTLYGETSQDQTIEIAVRPPYPRITKTGAISLKSGEATEINLPSDWFPGTRRALLTMSGLPAVGLTDAARFLLEYPYSCLEQSVSSGWTMLSAPELVSGIDPKLATREQLDYNMSRIMLRIQSMQLYNGSFSTWPSGNASDWNSVYATHFLVECEKNGISVPRYTLRNALEFLKYLIALPPEAADLDEYGAALAVRAYASYILAVQGDPPRAWMSYLSDHFSSLPQYGRILLAAAFAAANDTKTAKELLGENAPSIVAYDGIEKLNFDSPLRTKALYLTAWNKIDPSSPNAITTAAELLEMFHSSDWYTTQETAWTMMSLSEFYSHHHRTGDTNLKLYDQGANLLAEVSGDKNASLAISDDLQFVQVKNSGTDIGYATWTIDGVPINRPNPEDKGVKALVKYTDSQDIDISRNGIIERGERVYGEIILRPLAGTVKNFVIALPLPGGLEIENHHVLPPTEETGEYPGENSYIEPQYNSRAEPRDDRLLIFVDYVSKEFRWKFTLRAVTPGTFILPPIAAEGMYSPGTRSIGETSQITIK